MRITIATGPMLPVPAVRGGAIPRMWHGLAREFAARGHQVCVFTRTYPGQADEETSEGVRYIRFSGMTQSNNIAMDLAKDFCYAGTAVWRLPDADILVTNDFWLPAFAAILRKRAGRIVINANRYPKGQYRLYRRAGAIAAASAAVRDAVAREAKILSDRIFVIPNPVDTSVFFPGSAGLPRSRPRNVLYVGRIHPEKGVHLLAEAFAAASQRIDGWRLRILGPSAPGDGGGGAEYERKVRNILKDCPADFVGPVFEPLQLADEYRGADIFCYPSLAETGESFGLAVLEAMACGAPPIVSALACFRDLVSPGDTGWVFDHRAADPAAALTAALEDAMRKSGDSAALRERVAQFASRFGIREVADQYQALFSRLIQGQ